MNGERDGGRSRDYYSSRGDRDERRRDRRRSRSPGHRSRRDYEVDTYSSSRDYREREREERYSGRDRHREGREERGWDRDRGSRRDRRDEDERPPRRDRDLFDDRGGRNRRDRDRNDDAAAGGRGGRRRSASPPPKKREPTPDLTNVISVLERKRRMTQWDIKPPGYENVTAEQAKLSGMFPLPGAPRQQPMDPSRLQAFMNQPAGSANASALKASNARQSKRLFVYNFPSQANDEAVQDFFNLQLNHLNVVSSPDPCTSAQISKDRTFALLEFKTPEDATTALALDGISMESDSATNGSSNGAAPGLVIRRPKDYIVPAPAEEEEHQEGVISNKVKDSPQKIMVTNLPTALMEEQAHELLGSFGELKAFAMVKDSDTEQSKGIAFCEYLDPAATDIAVEGLNNMQISDQYIKVQKACVGLQQASGLEMGVSAMSMLAGTSSGDVEQGRVLMLLNMVTAEELMDKDEYEEICEDVKEECEKYGKVLELKIPRPLHGKEEKGVGKIYIKYDTPESAQKALRALAGRKFADRTVVVTFFSEEYFDVDAW